MLLTVSARILLLIGGGPNWRSQLHENAMRQVDTPHREFPRRWMAYPRWPFISIVVCAVLLAVVLAVFRTKFRTLDIFSAFLLLGAAVLSVLIVLYTRSLRRAQQIQLDTEERLQEMADNIQEIVWMIDAETKKALYVNAAYETITGRSCQSLLENPSSYEDLSIPKIEFMCLQSLERQRRPDTSMKDFGSCVPTGKCDG